MRQRVSIYVDRQHPPVYGCVVIHSVWGKFLKRKILLLHSTHTWCIMRLIGFLAVDATPKHISIALNWIARDNCGMDEWLRFSMTSLLMESILSETYLIESILYLMNFVEFRMTLKMCRKNHLNWSSICLLWWLEKQICVPAFVEICNWSPLTIVVTIARQEFRE